MFVFKKSPVVVEAKSTRNTCSDIARTTHQSRILKNITEGFMFKNTVITEGFSSFEGFQDRMSILVPRMLQEGCFGWRLKEEAREREFFSLKSKEECLETP